MNIRIALVLASILLLPGTALACADPTEPSFLHQLDSAKSVSVVRLLSLRLANTAPAAREVIGEVEIVRALKGKPTFRRIAYSNVSCGGLMPVVGHYFIVATSSTGDTLKLVRGDNSIIDINGDFAQTYPPIPERSKLQWHISNYLRGIPLPERIANLLGWANIYGAPPPPPPRPDDYEGT